MERRERGDRTRLRLIETAEQLYAERGVNGVSLREIGAAAKQRNTGAVRYHFHSKKGLLDAVFAHRMEPANALRQQMLAEFDRAGRAADPRALVEAMILPLAAHLGTTERPSWYLRFAAQAMGGTTSSVIDLDAQPWTAGAAEIERRLRAELSGLPPRILAHRWAFLVGFTLHALADRESFMASGGAEQPGDREIFLADLVDASVALVTAPVSDRTAELLCGNG